MLNPSPIRFPARRALWVSLLSATLVSGATLLGATLLGGCSKSPSGGPVVRASNRLQATLSVRGTLNDNYYYTVALDDIADDSQGPVAIVGNAQNSANGIVGGNFRVLVLYNRNNFRVFYRENPTDPATEIPVNTSTGVPFFTETPRATQNGIQFTLNLDATFQDGATQKFYFPNRNLDGSLATTRLDLNFVTSADLILASELNKIKPVDAFGFQEVASPIFNFQINSTRSVTIQDVVPDQSDPRPYDSSYRSVDFNQIDVTNLRIAITRG